MNKSLAFWLATLLLFTGASTIWIATKHFRGGERVAVQIASARPADGRVQPRQIADFTLTDSQNAELALQSLRGNVWIGSFFFTSCPSVCRQQNNLVRELYQEYEQQNVRFVSITCDPQNDTPQRLAEYARMYEADPQRWMFLTGDIDAISAIGQDNFQLAVGPGTHSDRLLVVDRWGQFRGMYDWHTAGQMRLLRTLVNELLAESEPPADSPAAATATSANHWEAEDWIEDFVLTERSGHPFDSADLAGQVWVTSFFYASCPSTCRSQNEEVGRLHREFGEKGVRFVCISCDPEQDTPEKLREYARIFNADPDQWLFLTGDLSYIRRIGAERFSLPVDKQAHVDRFVVTDKWGAQRGSFNWHDPLQMETLRDLLTQLISETEPPSGEASKEKTVVNADEDEPA